MIPTSQLDVLSLPGDEALLASVRDVVLLDAAFSHQADCLAMSDADRLALHAVIRKSFADDTMVAYVRLLKPDASGIAVLDLLWTEQAARCQGHASSLLTWAKAITKEYGYQGVRISGADAQFRLFERAGFVWADQHWVYRVSYAASVLLGSELHQTPKVISGTRQAQPMGSKTRAELQACTLELIAQTRREFCYYSRDLDPAVLDHSSVLDALRAVALKEKSRLRFLVQDANRAVKNGHRLIELARRLPTTILLRMPQAEDLQYPSAFAVNDHFGYLFRTFADRFDSEGDVYSVPDNSRLQRYFDEVWERAMEIGEFRRLGL
jgi:predicted GNAT family N-acyltransferase